jgi:hypothetical protein
VEFFVTKKIQNKIKERGVMIKLKSSIRKKINKSKKYKKGGQVGIL